MFVAVYDKSKDENYKSYVYGVINHGFCSKYIVLNPNSKTFKAVQYLDIDNPNIDRRTFINVIDSKTEGFKSLKGIEIKMLNKKLGLKSEGIKIKTFSGYEDLLSDVESLKLLVMGNEVSRVDVDFNISEESFAGEEWVQVNNQEDADNLMYKFAGFHDSVLESFSYLGESMMKNPKMDMEYYGKRRNLSMIFHSGWYGKVELCFDGVILMKNRPAGDNYSDELSSATLLVKEGKVFWADDDLEDIDLDYNYSFVYAYNLRWRTIFKSDKNWKEKFK